jgi:hypothetical protein
MTRYAFDAYVPTKPTNGLGIAGFVVSLVGLLGTGGLLCPIGLIMSLIALGRQPKGFAIAGVVIGLLGTCGGLIVALAFGAAVLALLGITAAVAFAALNDPQRMELTIDMANIDQAIKRIQGTSKYPPASLTELHLDAETLRDPWGNAYVYVLRDKKPGYDVLSSGKDGVAGTPDDVAMSNLDQMWNEFFQVNQDTAGNTVSIKMGDRTMTVHGGKDGGRVTIDTGEKTLNLSGGEEGGTITFTEDSDDAPEILQDASEESESEAEIPVDEPSTPRS